MLRRCIHAGADRERIEERARVRQSLPLRLRGEDARRRLPETPVGGGTPGCKGCGHGIQVRWLRQVEEGQPHSARCDIVLPHHGQHLVVPALALRALEVVGNHQPHACRAVPLDAPTVRGGRERVRPRVLQPPLRHYLLYGHGAPVPLRMVTGQGGDEDAQRDCPDADHVLEKIGDRGRLAPRYMAGASNPQSVECALPSASCAGRRASRSPRRRNRHGGRRTRPARRSDPCTPPLPRHP